MNANVLRTYKQLRRENPRYPSRTALAIARRRHTAPEWADGFTVDYSGVWSGEIDGFEVTISADVDDYADISYLGMFTDDPEGAVANPEWDGSSRNFKYFHPENVDSIEELRKLGYSRAEAEEVRKSQGERDARTAHESQFDVTVKVSRDGIELGSDSLGGCYIDDNNGLLWTVDDHGMIGEAISEAKAALKRLAAIQFATEAREEAKRQAESQITYPVRIALTGEQPPERFVWACCVSDIGPSCEHIKGTAYDWRV